MLQSSKLEIVELHTNVSRTHWSMGNGLRNAEKVFSTVILSFRVTGSIYFFMLNFKLVIIAGSMK